MGATDYISAKPLKFDEIASKDRISREKKMFSDTDKSELVPIGRTV
jgi:hypothetical protein